MFMPVRRVSTGIQLSSYSGIKSLCKFQIQYDSACDVCLTRAIDRYVFPHLRENKCESSFVPMEAEMSKAGGRVSDLEKVGRQQVCAGPG